MNLVINGEKKACGDGLSVSQLLIEQKVKMPEMVSVEVNGEILNRADFDSTMLQESDQIEFLYFMGGGRGTI